MQNDLNVLYIFISGRESRINNLESPQEFLYGYNSLKSVCKEVKYIEFSKKNNYIITFFSKFLRKISGLPIFPEYLLKISNLKIFLKSQVIICTNQRVAFSFLIIYSMLRIFQNKKMEVFIMGLLDVTHNSKIKNFIRNFLIKYLFFISDKLIFLGKSEFEFAKKNFNKYSSKYFFIPFSVDTNFWKPKLNLRKSNKNILFIGNDGKRDFNFLEELINFRTDLSFNVLSTKANNLTDYKNVFLFNGSFNSIDLSDEEVRELYYSSYLTIIPIVDTLQPSGQSVALQSIACGTPVLISNYRGFWDYENLRENENIFFEENDLLKWSNKIDQILKNEKEYDLVVNNGYKVIENIYSNKIFDKKIKNLLFPN